MLKVEGLLESITMEDLISEEYNYSLWEQFYSLLEKNSLTSQVSYGEPYLSRRRKLS